MTYSRASFSAATFTPKRTENFPIQDSGMCYSCIDGCIGLCELGRSAYRGHEVMYPWPRGAVATAGKVFPVDYSHFNIIGRALPAPGAVAGGRKAVRPPVSLDVAVGADQGLKFRLPWMIPGIGTGDVARNNWRGLVVGSALAGAGLAVAAKFAATARGTVLSRGRPGDTEDLRQYVSVYRSYQRDGYGAIIVQCDAEDTRQGLQACAIEKLGIECVELRWSQGTESTGPQRKVRSLARAQTLHQRGYVVLPNPMDPFTVRAFENGAFREFERHSRVGIVSEESLARRVDELRKAGARYVFLKTGACRPADMARALVFASRHKLDVLTVGGAPVLDGTSPWRMLNECGMPPVELHTLLHRYAGRLAVEGRHVPALVVAGGFTFEDQIFKGLALGAPYVKLVGMTRGPIAAAMVGKTIGQALEEGQIPEELEEAGRSKEEIFVTSGTLRRELGDAEFEELPAAAIGLYTYYERLAEGLRHLMAGNRKFRVDCIARDDIAALTRQAAAVSGIQYLMDVDEAEVEEILKP